MIGETIYVSGRTSGTSGSTKYYLYGILDTNDALIAYYKGDVSTSYVDVPVLIPTGADRIIVNGSRTRFKVASYGQNAVITKRHAISATATYNQNVIDKTLIEAISFSESSLGKTALVNPSFSSIRMPSIL